jgi:hypothetical protein
MRARLAHKSDALIKPIFTGKQRLIFSLFREFLRIVYNGESVAAGVFYGISREGML